MPTGAPTAPHPKQSQKLKSPRDRPLSSISEERAEDVAEELVAEETVKATVTPSVPSGGANEGEEVPPQAKRAGKWTLEEEEYAKRIIRYFNSGRLDLEVGAW